MVNLVPPRFYLSSDDSKPWFQGLSNLKLARRNRLDPDKKIAQSSTLENTDDSDKDKPIGEEDDGNDRGAGERSERKGSGKDGNSVNSEGKKRKRNSETKTGNEANPGNVRSEIEFGKVKIGDGAKPKELERERVESREKLISGRIHEKKIAQREKKLMRPGFEGRKEEFITKD
nr:ribosomal RNA-processing protein 14-C-like [Ipomoea batatas]